jgi:X-X-X-Leu-X-X-Gly heptad repeat protein
MVKPAGTLLLFFLLLVPVWAQDAAPAQSTAQPADKEKSAKREKNTGTSNDRLFFTLPNFLTLENAGNVPPLTAGQKFRVTARSTFDPVEFVWYGVQAGLSQATDGSPQYHQGAEGFGKRYGVAFADGTIENFFTKAILPSVLHEDPRYFQLGEGGFWHRSFYAIEHIFVTRTDSGRTEFNFSEILGSGTAAALSDFTYHSKDDHNLGGVLDTWGTQVLFDTLSSEVKEFWPDLRRKLHKSKTNTAPDSNH